MTGLKVHGRVMLGATFAMLASALIVGLSFLNAPMAEYFGVGLADVMLYLSIYYLVSTAMTSTFAPQLIDRFGARPVIIVGGVWSAAMLVGMGASTSLPMLYAFGGGLGLSVSACTSLAANVLVKEWFEARRGSVLGLVSGLAGLGGITLALVMPSVLNAGGWRLGFYFVASYVAALTVLPGLFLIRSRPADVGLVAFGATERASDGFDVEVPGVPASRAIRSSSFALLAGGLVLFNVVIGIHQHIVPLTMERGVDLTGASLVTSLISAAVVVGSILLGVLVDRWGTIPTMWLALAVMAAACGLFYLSRGLFPLLGSAALLGVALAMPMVLTAVLVMASFGPKDFTLILGPLSATAPLGGAIGAPAWGVVKDSFGSYDLALLAGIVASLISAVAIHAGVARGRALRASLEPEQGFSMTPSEDS